MTAPSSHGIAAVRALVDPEHVARLNADLVKRAEDAGLVDIAYTTFSAPFGDLLLAATSEGLVRVAFASEGHDAVLDVLAAKLSPRVLRAPRRLDPVARELDEYFSGVRTDFDVPLDRSLSTGFRQTVQIELSQIPYGTTLTYRQVADRVGNPAAVRAVGSACATNPLPIVVPCHRVLRTDGSLGGYLGGLDVKSELLRLEADRAGA